MKGKLIVAAIFVILIAISFAGCSGSNNDGKPKNKLPVASIFADKTTIFQGETVHVHGNNSYDPDGKIIEFKWDFGDGTYSDKNFTSRQYDKIGQYSIK